MLNFWLGIWKGKGPRDCASRFTSDPAHDHTASRSRSLHNDKRVNWRQSQMSMISAAFEVA